MQSTYRCKNCNLKNIYLNDDYDSYVCKDCITWTVNPYDGSDPSTELPKEVPYRKIILILLNFLLTPQPVDETIQYVLSNLPEDCSAYIDEDIIGLMITNYNLFNISNDKISIID